MNHFSGIQHAEVFEKGSYLSAGVYELEVTKTLIKETRKSGKGFIVEMQVVKSTSENHPVGSKATWFQKMSADGALGAIKEFALAVCGLDLQADRQYIKDEFDPGLEGLLNDAVGPENALKGSRVRVTVTMKKTQRGLDFSQHSWAPVPKAPSAA